MTITVKDTEFELSATLRTGERISKRFKKTIQEIGAAVETATIEELVTMLKIAVSDELQAKRLEDAILDGGCGMFDLFSYVTQLLMEITYPGSEEEKERQIAGAAMGEEQKNALRAALGLPVKNSEAQNSGNG